MDIPFFLHNISEKDIRAAVKAMRSRFITTGPITGEFEDLLSKKLNNKFSLGMTSCTTALHTALVALGIGPGDEVIVPPQTFVSSVNVIEYTGATPVFADVEADTGLIDPKEIEKKITLRTKAIIPVHLYGQMADMRSIRQIADKYKLKIIEDSAHSLDCERDGVTVGNLSDAAAFSFYATKNITCGEGGAVSTNNEELYTKMKVLRLHGMSVDALGRYNKKTFHQYDVKVLGFKYNMTDIQAALLMNQLKEIEKNTRRREEICGIFEKCVDTIEGMDYPRHKYGKSSRHLFCIWVNPHKRTDVIKLLNENGISVSVHFHPVHFLTYYKDKYKIAEGFYPNAERIGLSTITMPLYPKLTGRQIRYICEILKKAGKIL